MSVLLIFGCVVSVHLLLLVLWKYWCNRRYYTWDPRTPARVVLIHKDADGHVGIGIAGDTVVTVEAGSPYG